MEPVVITHLDDIGCSHSANVAMEQLVGAGFVTSGSIMVPPMWFAEAAAYASRNRNLDLGIHLTLTSESLAARWRPISTASHASGLIDDNGFMWPDVATLRRYADPNAIEYELRAQIETALNFGIDVTHLDHHMGAAMAPDFVAITVRLAIEYSLPMLFPAQMESYAESLELGSAGWETLEELRTELDSADLAIGDVFWMGLDHQGNEVRETFDRFFADPPPGTTYLSLHCSAPGDIDHVHPNDAAWRLGEYELFRDSAYSSRVNESALRLAGCRM